MNHEKMNDEELVKHLRNDPSSEKGWESLLNRYHRLIWHYIPKDCGDPDDLYQEIQMAVWHGILHNYRGKGSVLSYIATIARNQRSSYIRSFRKHPDMVEVQYDVPSGNSLQLEKIIEDESSSLILELLHELKVKERKMLMLRYFGYRHNEIAKVLGIESDGASRKYFHKLTNRIQRLCQKRRIGPGQFSEGMRKLYQKGDLHEMLNC